MSYNGWKNRETWNVALYINNDEPLHKQAVSFMKTYKGRKPYKDFVNTYMASGAETPDRVLWYGTKLDYNALNAMMRELI